MKTKKKPFHDKLPKKLVRLLRSVQEFIVEHPKQFDMDNWACPAGNSCQTVGCIAGHMALRDTPKKEVRAAILSDKDIGTNRLYNLVTDWLFKNIPYDLEGNFERLFFPTSHGWDKFRTKATKRITPKLAAKRIEYFLQTGK